MKISTPPVDVGIRALSYYLPDEECTVEEWARLTYQSDALRSALNKFGYDRVRVAAQSETIESMSFLAVGRLFGHYEIDPSTVDLIIHVHTFRYSVAPPPQALANVISRRFGCDRALCVGLANQSCASLVGAIAQVHALMSVDSRFQRALVFTADRVVVEYDRNMGGFAMLSDGASAVLLESGLTYNVIGGHATVTDVNVDHFAPSGQRESDGPNNNWFLNSLQVSRHALESLRQRNDAVSLWLQVNVLMREQSAVLKALKVPDEVLYRTNMARIGHAFCSDIIINLLDASRELGVEGRAALVTSSGDAGVQNAMYIQNLRLG
jgi:3-oxoacyl-[acyl-carrier-protein] synthase III